MLLDYKKYVSSEREKWLRLEPQDFIVAVLRFNMEEGHSFLIQLPIQDFDFVFECVGGALAPSQPTFLSNFPEDPRETEML